MQAHWVSVTHTFTIKKEHKMKLFIAGTIFGLIIATVGLSGVAKMFDNGVAKVQDISKEAAK